MRRGLGTIIPYRLLPLLTPKQLELQVCGSPTVDIALLKKNTKYSGYSEASDVIKFFWEMMETKFSEADRSNFLAFVWGRRRLPLKGADWSKKFTINSKYSSNPDSDFPLA